MGRKLAGFIACAAIALAGLTMKHLTHAQPNQASAANDAAASQSPADQGRYIVHHVAMCIYCHTPRDDEGVPDQQQLLRGAPMPIQSPFPQRTWAFRAPKIAGLPGGWNEMDMARFLSTGETPTGYKPRPPMPPFRFTPDDARAVTAYLQSLE